MQQRGSARNRQPGRVNVMKIIATKVHVLIPHGDGFDAHYDVTLDNLGSLLNDIAKGHGCVLSEADAANFQTDLARTSPDVGKRLYLKLTRDGRRVLAITILV